MVRRLPQCISYRRPNGNVRSVSLSPVIGAPVKNVAGLNDAWLNERVTCQALATLIRTQYNKSNPLTLFFTAVTARICSRQFRPSKETMTTADFHHVGPTFGSFGKHPRTVASFQTSLGQCGPPVCLYMPDIPVWWRECQHSRQSSSPTADCSTSERLTRNSDVLETISKD